MQRNAAGGSLMRTVFCCQVPILSVLPLEVASEAAQHLVDYLVRQQAFIGEQVVKTIRTTGSIPGALALTDQELIDHFPQLFAHLVEYFITEASPEAQKRTVEAAVKHGKARWRQGYQLTELVRELWLVHKAILDLAIEKFFELNPQWASYSKTAWRNLAGFFEDSVAGSVQRYVENHMEELRQVNSRLLEANKSLSRIDGLRLRLIRTVSHEIANVLNTLNLTITFLTISDNQSNREEMLRTCQRNVQEMSDLLDDLKGYSLLLGGAETPQKEEIDIPAFCSELESSFHAMTEDAGLRLILEIDAGLRTVRSDPKKIRGVLRNLAINAINYRNPERKDGTITLEFRSLDDNSWQIAVEDSGIGISPEHFDTIFEEFKRIAPSTHTKGTGLGLAITKRLVDELKGKIEVFSEVGQGTRFVLTFPKS
jgi:signal transduction histidine kinase